MQTWFPCTVPGNTFCYSPLISLCATSTSLCLYMCISIWVLHTCSCVKSPHFFSCAHLRIKQMQHTQTEYSSSHSHKPVKAYRPRSYLCINLNLLRGSNLLKGNKAKGYIIIFGVDPTGLGGWLLAPLWTFLPSQNSHPTDKSKLPFLGLISSSCCLAGNPKDRV